MINYIRTTTGKPVGFKAVVGATSFFDNLFAAINERGRESAPDFMTIDSADGGSGAAPMSLIDNMGLPLKESLPLVVTSSLSMTYVTALKSVPVVSSLPQQRRLGHSVQGQISSTQPVALCLH